MRPILVVIPQLQQQLLWPLCALLVLAGVAVSLRTGRSAPAAEKAGAVVTPLVLAAIAIGLCVLWSHTQIKLHSYGLFLILGFTAAVYSACLEARRKGIDPNAILDLALPLMFCSVLACRILYVALNSSQFHSLGDVVRVWDGGLSFHGSLVAAPLVIWYYARRQKMAFWQFADVIAPSVFLGYAIGRLGCLFNGCCYGAPTNVPWAMRFPDENNRLILTPPSHPTQLYSFGLALVLFALMQRAKVSPRFTRFHGQLTLLFFALYALERAFVEYFRNGATARPIFGIAWLTQAQFASALALIVIAALWTYLDARSRAHTAGPHEPAATPTGV